MEEVVAHPIASDPGVQDLFASGLLSRDDVLTIATSAWKVGYVHQRKECYPDEEDVKKHRCNAGTPCRIDRIEATAYLFSMDALLSDQMLVAASDRPEIGELLSRDPVALEAFETRMRDLVGDSCLEICRTGHGSQQGRRPRPGVSSTTSTHPFATPHFPVSRGARAMSNRTQVASRNSAWVHVCTEWCRYRDLEEYAAMHRTSDRCCIVNQLFGCRESYKTHLCDETCSEEQTAQDGHMLCSFSLQRKTFRRDNLFNDGTDHTTSLGSSRRYRVVVSRGDSEEELALLGGQDVHETSSTTTTTTTNTSVNPRTSSATFRTTPPATSATARGTKRTVRFSSSSVFGGGKECASVSGSGSKRSKNAPSSTVEASGASSPSNPASRSSRTGRFLPRTSTAVETTQTSSNTAPWVLSASTLATAEGVEGEEGTKQRRSRVEEIDEYVRSNTLSTILRHFNLNETYEKIRSDVDHVLYSEFRIRKEEAKAERAEAEALTVLQKIVKKNNREGAFNNFFELKSHCEMKASKIHSTDYLKPGEVVKNRLLEYYALMSLTLFRSVSMVSRNIELSQWTAPSLYYLKDRRAMDQYKFCDDDGILRISLPETNSMPLFGYNKGATTRIPREIQNAINRVISGKDNLDPNLFVIHPISQEELIDARDPVYQMFFLRNAHIYFS